MPNYLGESQITIDAIHGQTQHPNSDRLPNCLLLSVQLSSVFCSVGVVDSINLSDCMQLVPTVAFAELINRFPLVPHIVTIARAASRVRCVTQWRPI